MLRNQISCWRIELFPQAGIGAMRRVCGSPTSGRNNPSISAIAGDCEQAIMIQALCTLSTRGLWLVGSWCQVIALCSLLWLRRGGDCPADGLPTFTAVIIGVFRRLASSQLITKLPPAGGDRNRETLNDCRRCGHLRWSCLQPALMVDCAARGRMSMRPAAAAAVFNIGGFILEDCWRRLPVAQIRILIGRLFFGRNLSSTDSQVLP